MKIKSYIFHATANNKGYITNNSIRSEVIWSKFGTKKTQIKKQAGRKEMQMGKSQIKDAIVIVIGVALLSSLLLATIGIVCGIFYSLLISVGLYPALGITAFAVFFAGVFEFIRR